MNQRASEAASEELQQRLTEALDAYESGGTAAVEDVCRRYPHLADSLRLRLAGLVAMGLLDEAGEDVDIPAALGDFVPLRRLGGGGMGVVYLARQESLGREVALKLIRADQLHQAGARERFQREVETVARLQHPGIVPVFAVGEARGVPYLAMEHVHGRNLAEVVAALAGRDPSELSGADLAHALGEDTHVSNWVFEGSYAEACARLLRQAAEALEHAHRRGVVHRDLKPSNVMVTPDGRALLLDFGLASYEGSSKLTRTGSELGSLAYMAPEHLRSGRPTEDVRGDVYGLGVTLYELLALRSPFAADDREATRVAVLSADPPRLREFNRGVPWELETVCMKAMEAEPERRYASAADLARDLGNALEGRPVEARRAGVVLRTRRWVRRRPTASVAVLAGLLVLVLGPSLLAVQQGRARARLQLALDETERERLRATALADELRVQRDAAEAEHERAEDNLVAALGAVDVMLARVGDRKLRDVPRMDEVRRQLLEDALAFYGELLAQRTGPASTLDELELRLKLAQLELDAGDVASGEERLVDLLARIDGAALPGEQRAPLEYLRGRTLNVLAGVRYGSNSSPESLAMFEEASRVLRGYAQGPQATPAQRTTAAVVAANLALALWQGLRPREQVLEVLDGARALRERSLSDGYRPALQHVELAHVDSLRARCLDELGRREEMRAALESGRRELQLAIDARSADRDLSTRIASVALQLAYVLDRLGELEAAVELLAGVQPTSAALTRDFPDDQECFQNDLMIGANLAGALADLGRSQEAESELRRVIAAAEPRARDEGGLGGHAHLAAASRVSLAGVLLEQGRTEAAGTELERAFADLEAQARAGRQGTARIEVQGSLAAAHRVRATLALANGDHAQAQSDLERSTALLPADPQGSFELAVAWVNCAAALERDAALPEATRYARIDACHASALAALGRAAELGWSDAQALRDGPEWEALRGTPEFDALLEGLGSTPR